MWLVLTNLLLVNPVFPYWKVPSENMIYTYWKKYQSAARFRFKCVGNQYFFGEHCLCINSNLCVIFLIFSSKRLDFWIWIWRVTCTCVWLLVRPVSLPKLRVQWQLRFTGKISTQRYFQFRIIALVQQTRTFILFTKPLLIITRLNWKNILICFCNI